MTFISKDRKTAVAPVPWAIKSIGTIRVRLHYVGKHGIDKRMRLGS